MLETFCLRLALGLVLGLLVLPAGQVHARFYRIHFLIVLGLIVAAGLAAREREHDLFWLGLGFAAAAAMAGYVSWWIQKRAAVPVFLLNIAVLFFCVLCLSSLANRSVSDLYFRFISEGPATGGMTISTHLKTAWLQRLLTGLGFAVADNFSSAALLGTALTAMLMGHWYLITPTMSLQPLLRLHKAFFLALGLRTLVSALGLWYLMGDRLSFQELDKVGWYWLELRWTAGIIAPLLLGWMSWTCARIRSTQSATGILYVLVIVCFIGEPTDQVLQAHVQSLPQRTWCSG